MRCPATVPIGQLDIHGSLPALTPPPRRACPAMARARRLDRWYQPGLGL